MLHRIRARQLHEAVGAQHLAALARIAQKELRAVPGDSIIHWAATDCDYTREALLAESREGLIGVARETCHGLRRVINASGVILHTNLGRAPLSDAARRRIAGEAAGYCTLEYDASTGERGRRGARVEQLLADLTGAEAALVVNNCAAAALLILTVLAAGGEAICRAREWLIVARLSRPRVMNSRGRDVSKWERQPNAARGYDARSQTRRALCARSHLQLSHRLLHITAPARRLADLRTRLGLRSTRMPDRRALLIVATLGLKASRSSAVNQGWTDVISFSGDKLLGAAHAGLIVGRREIIKAFRRHPLYRALRADKFALAALERRWRGRPRVAFKEGPVLRCLRSP